MNAQQADTPQLAPDLAKIRRIEKATLVDQAWSESTKAPTRLLLTLRRQFLSYYFFPPPLWKVLLRSLNEQRMVPAYMCLGAVRSGTTLLSDYILQHPCVLLPQAKEQLSVDIAKASLLRAQYPTLAQQKRHERRRGMAITGFHTPIMPNILFPHMAKVVMPDAKVVIIMRNPVDRAFAHFRWDQVLTAGLKKDPFWSRLSDFSELVRLEIDAIEQYGAASIAISGVGGGYVQHSIYLPFLKQLFTMYDKNKAMFIDANEFFQDTIPTVKRVYEFLGLPKYEPVPQQVKNAGPPGKMDDATRALLAKFFEPLNKELYEYVGRDFGWR